MKPEEIPLGVTVCVKCGKVAGQAACDEAEKEGR